MKNEKVPWRDRLKRKESRKAIGAEREFFRAELIEAERHRENLQRKVKERDAQIEHLDAVLRRTRASWEETQEELAVTEGDRVYLQQRVSEFETRGMDPHPSLVVIGERMFVNSKRWFDDFYRSASREDIIHHLTHGIGGESGEVIDIIKKWQVCGHFNAYCEKHDPGKHSSGALEKELTDLLFYTLMLATYMGFDLNQSIEAVTTANEIRFAPKKEGTND